MTAITTPFRVSTGATDEPFAHPKCYARCLHNCSRKISGEHYFTHALLRKIGLRPSAESTSGAPLGSLLAHGYRRMLSRLRFYAIVITRNSPPLDDFASSLDDELVRIYKAAKANHAMSTVVRFHGPNLERWLMKSLCGFVAARPSIFGPYEAGKPVPDEWVRYPLWRKRACRASWCLSFTQGRRIADG